MNLHQIEMLRAIRSAPRAALHFTHGFANNRSPNVVDAYLAVLEEAGYIETGVHRNRFSITEAGEDFLAELDARTPTPGRTWCSASTGQPYVSPAWNVRAGGEDHQAHKSRGF